MVNIVNIVYLNMFYYHKLYYHSYCNYVQRMLILRANTLFIERRTFLDLNLSANNTDIYVENEHLWMEYGVYNESII